jgi:hypothetical protein
MHTYESMRQDRRHRILAWITEGCQLAHLSVMVAGGVILALLLAVKIFHSQASKAPAPTLCGSVLCVGGFWVADNIDVAC